MTADLMVFLAKLISGANARWLGVAPDTRQRIYFANHTSNLDALVLWAVLPPEVRALTRPVAARDYWSTGIRRYMADKIFHAILIERHKPTAHDNPIEQILEAMGSDKSIIIFPEGTRSHTGTPQAFKAGLFHLAEQFPHVPLVPTWIDNVQRVMPKGEVVPVPILCTVTFGEPISLQPGESKADFLVRAREALLAHRPNPEWAEKVAA